MAGTIYNYENHPDADFYKILIELDLGLDFDIAQAMYEDENRFDVAQHSPVPAEDRILAKGGFRYFGHVY